MKTSKLLYYICSASANILMKDCKTMLLVDKYATSQKLRSCQTTGCFTSMMKHAATSHCINSAAKYSVITRLL